MGQFGVVCIEEEYIYIYLQIYRTVLYVLEFENAEALINSEVFMLLEHRKSQNDSTDEEQELFDVFVKTLTYTQRYSRYNNRKIIQAV